MQTEPWTNCYAEAAHADNTRRASDLAGERRKTRKPDYFCSIGGATFSTGAGGNTGWAPGFCAPGRAGSGETPDGLVPVVTGSDGADGLLSAPGVDCSGGVACARYC